MPGSDGRRSIIHSRLEIAAWTLIYGGLAVAGIGLFVTREPGGAVLGGTLIVAGAAALVVGIALVYLRSRSGDRAAPKS